MLAQAGRAKGIIVRLKVKNTGIIHLSHFHRLVSAYVTSEESLADLEHKIIVAIREARLLNERRIVEQDCIEHIFVVFPSGTIALYREVGCYEVWNDSN